MPSPQNQCSISVNEWFACGSDRSRRMRDAVEAALSDIILLGTEEQVNLAAQTARELVAGRHLHTHELVVSLRNFIRHALDLEPISTGLEIPMQDPTRPGGGGAGSRERGEAKAKENAGDGGERGGAGGGGGRVMGMGGMAGLGVGHGTEEKDQARRFVASSFLAPSDGDSDQQPKNE